MDDKTNPNSLYTTQNDNKHTNEDIGNVLDDERNDSPQWGEDAVTRELMNMKTIDVHDVKNQNVTDVGDQNIDGIIKQGLRFYVEQLGNEVEFSIIGTSNQGNGRAINLFDSI
jgi:hypothetical protein